MGSNLRPKVLQEDILRGVDEITAKLHKRLLSKGDGAYASRHEIWGILCEEYDEALDELRINTPDGYENFAKELKDIAVGAMFGYICVRFGYICPAKKELDKWQKASAGRVKSLKSSRPNSKSSSRSSS